MSETSQAIVACVIIAFIFACLVIYHWDTIVKALRDPEPPPVMPDGVIDFTDEDWFFAEAHSPQLLVWRPPTALPKGKNGHILCDRGGMCLDCYGQVKPGDRLFLRLGSNEPEKYKYGHYSCAVTHLTGTDPFRRRVEEIESTPPDD